MLASLYITPRTAEYSLREERTADTLTAVLSVGFKFTNWTGGGCAGTAQTCGITITKETQVQANFSKK